MTGLSRIPEATGFSRWSFTRRDLDAQTSAELVARVRAHQHGREIPTAQQRNLELSMT